MTTLTERGDKARIKNLASKGLQKLRHRVPDPPFDFVKEVNDYFQTEEAERFVNIGKRYGMDIKCRSMNYAYVFSTDDRMPKTLYVSANSMRFGTFDGRVGLDHAFPDPVKRNLVIEWLIKHQKMTELIAKYTRCIEHTVAKLKTVEHLRWLAGKDHFPLLFGQPSQEFRPVKPKYEVHLDDEEQVWFAALAALMQCQLMPEYKGLIV